MRPIRSALILTAVLVSGCRASGQVTTSGLTAPPRLAPPESPLAPSEPHEPASKATIDAFGEATADIRRHDLAGDWSEAECLRLGQKLAIVPRRERPLTEALFNAAVAFDRCGKEAEAAAQFRASVAADSRFAPARVQVALRQYESDAKIDEAIGALEAAVLDAQFQSPDGLVSLARLQRRRAGTTGGLTCSGIRNGTPVAFDGLECARLNAQRALAIDESSAPAMNELALYYVARARGQSRSVAAAPFADVPVRMIDLAITMCDATAKRYPGFAPIHVTRGLAFAARDDFRIAIAEFDRARQLDPRSFGAHMNYADANISVRDFASAEQGYRRAVALRPNDYGAHLGLALALRGLITDANLDAQVARVQTELDTCRRLNPARPDAYYNAAILTQDFKAKAAEGQARVIAALGEARSLYLAFIGRAAAKADYAPALARAKQRMQDVDDIIGFLQH